MDPVQKLDFREYYYWEKGGGACLEKKRKREAVVRVLFRLWKILIC